MSYTSIVQMAGSTSLMGRVAAAAASEGLENPLPWVQTNIWTIVSKDTGWVTAWDYAIDTSDANDNPDTGARPGVINDAMILAVIQPMVNPPEPEPEPEP